MRLNDATPSEWDKAAKPTATDRQSEWQELAHVGLEAWAEPAEKEAEEISLDDCTTDLDWGLDWDKEDMVGAPYHYNTGNIECIDAIEESMSSVAFKGYLKGNCMKYLWRYETKHSDDPLQDLKKAEWYLSRLIELVGEDYE